MRRALFARLFTPPRLALLAMVLTTPAMGAGLTSFGPLEAMQPLNAKVLAEQIRQDGAQEVGRRLTREHEWPRVRRAVAAGWENWIVLVPDLIPVADPGTSRALQAALRRALIHNPRAVLSILDRKDDVPLGGKNICAPAAEPASWRPRALTAIREVHDIHLIDRGTGCLHALEEEKS